MPHPKPQTPTPFPYPTTPNPTKVATGKESRGSNGAQPAASDMNLLVWDEEVALGAQKWADQCQFGHDDERDVERFSVGQVTPGAPDQHAAHSAMCQ